MKWAYTKDKKVRFLVSKESPDVVEGFCFREDYSKIPSHPNQPEPLNTQTLDKKQDDEMGKYYGSRIEIHEIK